MAIWYVLILLSKHNLPRVGAWVVTFAAKGKSKMSGEVVQIPLTRDLPPPGAPSSLPSLPGRPPANAAAWAREPPLGIVKNSYLPPVDTPATDRRPLQLARARGPIKRARIR